MREEIKLYLEQLNKKLAKHSDVRSVFRAAVREEIELNQRLLLNTEIYTMSWYAFIQNIDMLRTIQTDDNE